MLRRPPEAGCCCRASCASHEPCKIVRCMARYAPQAMCLQPAVRLKTIAMIHKPQHPMKRIPSVQTAEFEGASRGPPRNLRALALSKPGQSPPMSSIGIKQWNGRRARSLVPAMLINKAAVALPKRQRLPGTTDRCRIDRGGKQVKGTLYTRLHTSEAQFLVRQQEEDWSPADQRDAWVLASTFVPRLPPILTNGSADGSIVPTDASRGCNPDLSHGFCSRAKEVHMPRRCGYRSSVYTTLQLHDAVCLTNSCDLNHPRRCAGAVRHRLAISSWQCRKETRLKQITRRLPQLHGVRINTEYRRQKYPQSDQQFSTEWRTISTCPP